MNIDNTCKIITIKIKQLITMVKKLKQLSFYEQLMSSIAIFVATSVLGGGLIMWRSIAVQGNEIDNLKLKTEKIENNSITLREYIDLKQNMNDNFQEIKQLMKDDRELWQITNNKINKHLGVE